MSFTLLRINILNNFKTWLINYVATKRINKNKEYKTYREEGKGRELKYT